MAKARRAGKSAQHKIGRKVARKRSTLAAALQYARHGLPVFPIHTPIQDGCSCGKPSCNRVGKHPRTRHGLLDATTDEKLIRQWWTQWPKASIGIATGAASGLAVLDIDPRHGGDEMLAGWEREHGPLPDTVESLTGGGGRHIFFAHPGGHVKSRSLAPGVDVKGDGGYVVAPPSLHAGGRRYRWDGPSSLGDVAPASLPEWLWDMLASPPTESGQPSARGAEPLGEGMRNAALTSLAGVMRRAGMVEGEIRAGLLEVNRQRCRPRLLVQEVSRIAGSIGHYLPGEVPVLGSNSSPSSLLRVGDRNDGSAPVELRTLAKPGPREWVVEDLVPLGTQTILFGGGGLAKSLLAMFIGDSVARGQELLGRQVRQGRVLYLDWELDVEEQARRAYRVAAGVGYSSPAPGLFYKRMALPLSEALSQITGWIEGLQISLAILDSFGLATLGDPTSAKDVVPLLAAVSRLPSTTVFIDHIRNVQPREKGDDLNPFGSVYKYNIARSVIRVVRVDGDEFTLSVLLRHTKSNFGALSEPLGLRVTFEEESVSFEQASLSSPPFKSALDRPLAVDKVYRALAEAEEATLQQLANATGLALGTVRNKLYELKREWRAHRVGKGLWRPGIKKPSSSSPSLGDGDDDASAGRR